MTDINRRLANRLAGDVTDVCGCAAPAEGGRQYGGTREHQRGLDDGICQRQKVRRDLKDVGD